MCQGPVCVQYVYRNRQYIWLLMALCRWRSRSRVGRQRVSKCVSGSVEVDCVSECEHK